MWKRPLNGRLGEEKIRPPRHPDHARQGIRFHANAVSNIAARGAVDRPHKVARSMGDKPLPELAVIDRRETSWMTNNWKAGRERSSVPGQSSSSTSRQATDRQATSRQARKLVARLPSWLEPRTGSVVRFPVEELPTFLMKHATETFLAPDCDALSAAIEGDPDCQQSETAVLWACLDASRWNDIGTLERWFVSPTRTLCVKLHPTEMGPQIPSKTQRQRAQDRTQFPHIGTKIRRFGTEFARLLGAWDCLVHEVARMRENTQRPTEAEYRLHHYHRKNMRRGAVRPESSCVTASNDSVKGVSPRGILP